MGEIPFDLQRATASASPAFERLQAGTPGMALTAEPVDDGAYHVRSKKGAVVDAGFVGDGNDVGAEAFGRTRVVTLDEQNFRCRRRRHGAARA